MKEDSTRGKAMVNPRSYKRDVMTQTWLESRQLATIMRWLDANGRFVRFKSDIVRECVEQIYYHIIENKLSENVDFAEDARRMLESRFGDGSNNNSGRGKRNEIHNLVLDDRRKEGRDYAPAVTTTQQQYVAPAPVSSGSRTPTLDAWKEQQLRENAQKELKRLQENSTRDEDGCIVTATSGDCSTGVTTYADKWKADAEAEAREKKLARSKAKVKQEEKDASKREECEIRVRSQEEIEEYRRKRDKEKEEEMDRIG